jgi:hypothetical protein
MGFLKLITILSKDLEDNVLKNLRFLPSNLVQKRKAYRCLSKTFFSMLQRRECSYVWRKLLVH